MSSEPTFQYDQLRKEILQNQTAILQILGFTLALTGTLFTLALTKAVPTEVSYLFLIGGGFVVLISCLMIIDTEDSTFNIAAYLRTFLEPNLASVKWETRLYLTHESERPKQPSSVNEFLRWVPDAIFLKYHTFTVHVFLALVSAVSSIVFVVNQTPHPVLLLQVILGLGGIVPTIITCGVVIRRRQGTWDVIDTCARHWRGVEANEKSEGEVISSPRANSA
jgi:hypothetical protein